jgi:hypothetical protein
MRGEGGCFLTHVAQLERKEGQPFSGEQACAQSELLSNFLTFVAGGWSRRVCEVGLDGAGGQIWQICSTPRSSSPPYSWFNPHQPDQLEDLYPRFARRWQQSQSWRRCLRTVIYWSAVSSGGNGTVHLDSSLVLLQSALERLAYQSLVLERRMITSEGLDS